MSLEIYVLILIVLSFIGKIPDRFLRNTFEFLGVLALNIIMFKKVFIFRSRNNQTPQDIESYELRRYLMLLL